MRLTEAQRRNLEHVRDHGKPTPRSRAGFNCRVKGLTEFVWLRRSGVEISNSDYRALPMDVRLQDGLDRMVREQLTDAGRRALEGRP